MALCIKYSRFFSASRPNSLESSRNTSSNSSPLSLKGKALPLEHLETFIWTFSSGPVPFLVQICSAGLETHSGPVMGHTPRLEAQAWEMRAQLPPEDVGKSQILWVQAMWTRDRDQCSFPLRTENKCDSFLKMSFVSQAALQLILEPRPECHHASLCDAGTLTQDSMQLAKHSAN